MTLGQRVRQLERAGHGHAPAACLVYVESVATVYIWATAERMPLAEYDRRWPRHTPLKCYLDWAIVTDDWSHAPPPRSSADV